MMFNKKLLDIIACPVCKGQLVLHEVPLETQSDGQEQKLEQTLVCRFDRLSYPIDEGIPVLLESDSRVLTLEELEKVKTHG
jgi:hypothetical protein